MVSAFGKAFGCQVIRDLGSDSMVQAIEDSVFFQQARKPFFYSATGLSATSCATQPTAMEYNGGASSYNFRPVVVAAKTDIFLHQASLVGGSGLAPRLN